MADKDIAPELIDKVNKDFDSKLADDKKVAELSQKLTEGKADYEDAYRYAESVGKARADAFGNQLSSEILPEGKMQYNIASRLLEDSLSTDHELVAEYAAEVQRIYNEQAGIGLKALKPDVDQDRIKGFIEGVCNADNYDDVAWKLMEPVITHARSVVDDAIKKNAEFHHGAGIKATVKRRAVSKCCKWCAKIDGDYTYPDVPRKVFQRHDNCKCTVEYKGRKLTAYSSGGKANTFRDQGEQERIASRKELDKAAGQIIVQKFGDKTGQDITRDYLKKITPGVGNITRDPDFIEKDHVEEIEFAKWIKRIAGGNIVQNKDYKEKHYSDYTWNGKLWELKTISSGKFNTIDQHIRTANKQITENRGGIFVDISNNKLSFEEMNMNILKSMSGRNIGETVIFMKKGDSFKVFLNK